MSSQRPVYIGSFTKETGGEGTGISLARQDTGTGALTLVSLVAKSISPAFLAWHPDGRHLYAVNEEARAAITAYEVTGEGGLRELTTAATGGNGACHLVVHPSGGYVLSASYGSGSLSVHPIGDDGSIGERTDFVQHLGSGPRIDRQSEAHAHHIRVDPSGQWVLAVDLGTDSVITYTLDLELGRLVESSVAKTEPGAGPRHLAFAPDNKHIYVAGELDSTVTTFAFDAGTGVLTKVAVAPSTVAEAPADNYPSEIAISDDGAFLYVANRGLDLVTALAVSGPDVRPVSDVPTGGAWPRHLAVFGGHLYVANERSHDVTHFVLNAGVPEQAGDVLAIPSPACILPAPA
ncbi:lactonase family protein [Flindersiella endophytica]